MNSVMNPTLSRLCACFSLLLAMTLAVAGCDHSIQDQLKAIAAAEKSLDISPTLFATRFNRTMIEVLEDRKDPDAAHMAALYVIDVTALANNDERRVFQTQVGPSRTTLIGTFARNGDLKSIGTLLTQPTEAARTEFYLCAETIARVASDASKEKLPTLIRQLVDNALNNPGQNMSEVIGDRILSAQIIKTGLLFQVERQQ
jgi:hypothetical protein